MSSPRWFNVLDFGAQRTNLASAAPYNAGGATVQKPPPDSTAAFKAATDAAGAAGGGIVYVPAGYYLGRFEARSRVIVQGDGFATWIKAPLVADNSPGGNPANALPMYGATWDAWHCGIRDLVLEGNRNVDANGKSTSGSLAGGATGPTAFERGISLSSPDGDAYEVSLGGADAGTSTGPEEPLLLVDNVQIWDTGGDGCYVGANYRGARVTRLEVLVPGGNGIVIACSDSLFSDCVVQQCHGLAGVVCLGSSNQLANIDSQVAGDLAAGVYASASEFPFFCGFLIYGRGSQLDNCKSEDNAGPAMTVGAALPPGYTDFSAGTGAEVTCRNLICCGNGYGIVIDGGSGNHDIDAAFTSLDRSLFSSFGVTLFGAAAPNPLRLRLGVEWVTNNGTTAGVDQAAWQYLALGKSDPSGLPDFSSDLAQVSLQVVGADRTRVESLAAQATLQPDIVQGLNHVITLTGDAAIGPLAHRNGCMPGDTVDFVLVQDGTGGHALSWDASWNRAEQPAGSPGSVSAQSFVNVGLSPAKPEWVRA